MPERGPNSQAWDGQQKEKHWGLNGKVLGGEGRVPGGLPVPISSDRWVQAPSLNQLAVGLLSRRADGLSSGSRL